MASLSRDPNGCRRVQFSLDGRRRTLRLGIVPARTAETWRAHLEQLLSARAVGTAPPDETSRWLGALDGPSYERIVRLGLAAARQATAAAAAAAAAALGVFIASYTAERQELKSTTLNAMSQSTKSLTAFFGAAKPLRAITAADADAWRATLIAAALARATVNKRCRYARHFFAVALRRNLIASNPFGHISGAVAGNPARRVFVPAATVRRVMEEMPDVQWRLLLALARWGGLRTPSEALALTWHDIDFAGRRIIVRASKTAHHADGGVRIMPMFPELGPLLQEAFDQAQPGETHVITRYRSASCNLRTQLHRYIARAGVTPWPKLWQNLRASRATELVDQFPSHVCAAWLGHTERIADTFYRTVTDEHFLRATASAENLTQNLTQQTPESSRNGQKPKNPPTPKPSINPANCGTLPPVAARCEMDEWALRDSNYPHQIPSISAAAAKPDAKSDAFSPRPANYASDPVAEWLAAMPASLPRRIRKAVLAILDAD